ncbi:lytic transglycosylase domain-containing protein, partial [Methylobacterium sp. WL93]
MASLTRSQIVALGLALTAGVALAAPAVDLPRVQAPPASQPTPPASDATAPASQVEGARTAIDPVAADALKLDPKAAGDAGAAKPLPPGQALPA